MSSTQSDIKKQPSAYDIFRIRSGNMKVRIIILILSIICLLSTSIGGFLYYSSLKQSAVAEAHSSAAATLGLIVHQVRSLLNEYQRSVRVLAGLEKIRHAFESRDGYSLDAANEVLDHFTESLKVSVCYLMDAAGNTIATSNRNSKNSFLGKNYGFRPYFKKAIAGRPAVFFALGVTSGKRGAYFSHPVYAENNTSPIGVAVIKAYVDVLEGGFSPANQGEVLMTDPHGVVFLSSRKDWLFKTLWQCTPDEIHQIDQTRQFGKGPWEWIGLTYQSDSIVEDNDGYSYRLHKINIDENPGWDLIFLHSHNKIAEHFSTPAFKSSSFLIIALCFLLGIAIFFLYREAAVELRQRKKAEKEKLERQKFKGALEMAGAVCHELNQPLQSVLIYSELMLTGVAKDHLMHGYLNSIIEQIRRMGDITKKLMKITTYETKEYIQGRKILDIHKASIDIDIRKPK